MGHYYTIFRVDKATFVTAICFVILGVGHIVPSQQQLTENHQILVLCKNQSPSIFLGKGTGWGLFSQIWILLAFSSPPLLGWLEAFHAPFSSFLCNHLYRVLLVSLARSIFYYLYLPRKVGGSASLNSFKMRLESDPGGYCVRNLGPWQGKQNDSPDLGMSPCLTALFYLFVQ